MEKKVAVVAVIISKETAVEKINNIFHDFGEYIIGRLGLPYRERGINIINVVLDAPQETINSLSGKLGMVDGAKSKVMLTK